MRRDVFITNDSGGLSVVAADALDAIIEDGRENDLRFVKEFKALPLELYGDDSMPVRIVVDEPLSKDEEAQWLARATWRLDTTDGRLLVMGGFDPDVMASWRDETGGTTDDGTVAVIEAKSGAWRVDVYAHPGSMNGRAILGDAGEPTGAAFRRSHGDRAFPLWLAHALQFSSADDPGHEDIWNDLTASLASGALRIDFDSGDAIGFLVHVTPFNGSVDEAPADGWFARDLNARMPSTFPLGIPSDVPDPELRSFSDRLLGREAPAPEARIAEGVVEIIEVWKGDPLKKLDGDAPIAIAPHELFHLYWLAAFCADSPPRFELWIEAKRWTPPAPTPEFGVAKKSGGITAIGPSRDMGGWQLWWTARHVSTLLTDLPEKTEISLGMTPRLDYNADLNPAVGRMLYNGVVADGQFRITEISPLVSRDALEKALAFVRDVVRRASASSDDERFVLMDATPKFRAQFGTTWPVDQE